MARKTFISYKYQDEGYDGGLRDQIINALGRDGIYYQGETSNSPDMGDLTTETIKKNLSDMIFNTSILIVIISQNIDNSQWVQWEINYATHKSSRNGRQSQPNDVVFVVKDELITDGTYRAGIITRENVKNSGVNKISVSASNFLSNPQAYMKKI
ncbi:MAG: TIR domain-containing protein [Streptococcaceae bacterium]|nr:TIR domain-containing protein [Streptococcaceae bacterium]MCL2681263.1 TIR domain-containing protein [Streptococcaceae bacterium]MCL2858119.1 TIR domain-containing protein [Streptococcaceae bacterium]